MKSIKPGRGPSMMSGIVGIFMICFGVVWTVMAAQASFLFALAGIAWTAIAVVNTVYNFKNATKGNRYSSFDIVDGEDEPDPLNKHYGNTSTEEKKTTSDNRFCPYCGNAVGEDFEFCNSCGKKLP